MVPEQQSIYPAGPNYDAGRSQLIVSTCSIVASLVAHLLVGVSEQPLRLRIVGIGEDDVLQSLRDPAVLTLVEVHFRLLQDRRSTAHGLDVFPRRVLGRGSRWQRIGSGR
jgi:hypothetical protein